MELKKENLLSSYADNECEISTEDMIELRTMQLFKIAEFLNDYFNGEYSEKLFQMRCEWCKVQLDHPFFDKLNEASQCQDQEQRSEIMKELHIYVEDFLIAFCEEFFTKLDKKDRTQLIYAGHFLHFRMDREKLDKFFYITGMLKKG